MTGVAHSLVVGRGPIRARLTSALRRLSQGGARTTWTVGLSTFFCFCLYRAFLWRSLATSSQPPLGFVFERYWPQELVSASGWDVLVSLIIALPFVWTRRMTGTKHKLALMAGCILVALSSFLCAVHLRLLLARGEHVGYAALREVSLGAMTWREAISYAAWTEIVLLVAPLVIFAFVSWSVGRLTGGGFKWLQLGTISLVVGIVFCSFLPRHDRFQNRIHHNPILYGVADVIKGALKPEPQLHRVARSVSAEQSRSIRLIDAQFFEPGKRSAPLPPQRRSTPYNVVLVILESTAGRDVFYPTWDGSVAMPFLQKLSKESWWMNFHHSTSNSSHRSLFSLFTGLYPSFGEPYFCLTDEVHVPTLSTFLPENYGRFLVTPGDLRSYFPRKILENSGMPELLDRSALLSQSRRRALPNALHELDAFEAFERRMAGQKGPFFAVYYSYVPHFHYRDYGPKYRVMPQIGNPRHRYINNLRLVDELLERIVQQLKETGRWDDTILAVVGDHGESFGEHHFFTHANDMHEEAIRTPFLLRFPGVAPRVVDEPTSHVDFLPTLLDAMGIEYDVRQLQGESLWNEQRSRRYIFGVGNERGFVSIDQARTKLLSKEVQDSCVVYDLGRDPKEQSPQRCVPSSAQYQALADFRLFQSSAVQRFSREGKARGARLLPQH